MPRFPSTTIIGSVEEIVPRPIAWICDIWGVIHNGVTAYPDAVAACVAFRASGGHIIFVTNAPRPSAGVVAQLDALGVPKSAYDVVLTSGDVTRERLAEWRSVPTLHIGPSRDIPLFEGLGIPLANSDEARRILCSGLYDDTTETPENYRQQLHSLAARRVPMLCANPDIKVDRGGQIMWCAGGVAALYEQLGGAVEYAGKPHPPVYKTARRLIAKLAGRECTSGEIIAIGDGVYTDIPGGIADGLRTVYVSSAIHLNQPITSDALLALFATPADAPDYAIENFA